MYRVSGPSVDRGRTPAAAAPLYGVNGSSSGNTPLTNNRPIHRRSHSGNTPIIPHPPSAPINSNSNPPSGISLGGFSHPSPRDLLRREFLASAQVVGTSSSNRRYPLSAFLRSLPNNYVPDENADESADEFDDDLDEFLSKRTAAAADPRSRHTTSRWEKLSPTQPSNATRSTTAMGTSRQRMTSAQMRPGSRLHGSNIPMPPNNARNRPVAATTAVAVSNQQPLSTNRTRITSPPRSPYETQPKRSPPPATTRVSVAQSVIVKPMKQPPNVTRPLLPPNSMSATKISWPISVSLSNCANKAARELIEHLMRKYGWVEGNEQTATLLWTDQKVARSYKSFRLIAQTSPWFTGTRDPTPFKTNQTQSSPTTSSTVNSTTNPSAAAAATDNLFSDRSQMRFTNHLPQMHEIVTKANLSASLAWYQSLFPQQFDFIPKSFDLGIASEMKAFQEALEENKTSEREKDRDANASKMKTYIIKPHAGRQGEGIVLVQKWNEVQHLLTNNPGRHYVASEYIADPLLLDGFKFDCRVYVLVESLQPFRAYLMKEGLARLATSKYHRPSPQNLHQQYMHLTNYSLNKSNDEGFQHSQENHDEWDSYQDEHNLNELSNNNASKRSIRTALLQLRLQGVQINLDSFWNSVDEIVQKTLCCMWPALQHNYNRHFPDTANVDIIKSNKRGMRIQPQMPLHANGVDTMQAPHATGAPSSNPLAPNLKVHILSRGNGGKSVVHGGSGGSGAPPTTSPSSSSSSRSNSNTSEPDSNQDDSDIDRDDNDDDGSGSDADNHSGSEADSQDDEGDADSDSEALPAKQMNGKPSKSIASVSIKDVTNSRASSQKSSTNNKDRRPSETINSSPSPSSASPITSFPVPPAPPSLLTPAVPSHCFHLLGFDILLDSNLKPWLLEVNAAPSMNLDSALDKRIKLAVLERSFELMGLIPPGGPSNHAAPLFDPDEAADYEYPEPPEEESKEEASRKPRGFAASSNYSSGNSVIAAPTQYKRVTYTSSSSSGSDMRLEEKEMQHTMIVKQKRRYDYRDMEYVLLQPDKQYRTLFPFGSATIQRMFLTFTAKRYSTGLSIGAFNRLVTMYGLVNRSAGNSANNGGSAPGTPFFTATSGHASSGNNGANAGNISTNQAGDIDLMFMRILRRSNERVMSFHSFCQALLALAVMKYPHTSTAPRTSIDAFTLLVHEVERRLIHASDRAQRRAEEQAALAAAKLKEEEFDDELSPTNAAIQQQYAASQRALQANGVKGSLDRRPSTPSRRSSDDAASTTMMMSHSRAIASAASTRTATHVATTAGSNGRSVLRVGASSPSPSPPTHMPLRFNFTPGFTLSDANSISATSRSALRASNPHPISTARNSAESTNASRLSHGFSSVTGRARRYSGVQ